MSIDDYDDFYSGKDGYWVSQYGLVQYYDEEAVERVKRRIWIMRRDGIRQRYWVWGTFKGAMMRRSGRFNWSGTAVEIGEAIALTKGDGFVPVGFIDVNAMDFLHNPLKYSKRGIWITHEIGYD